MSTESNRKWARVDKRRAHAHELLESWINGNRNTVLRDMERNPQSRRLLAAMVDIAIDSGHGDRFTKAIGEICERIYREL